MTAQHFVILTYPALCTWSLSVEHFGKCHDFTVTKSPTVSFPPHRLLLRISFHNGNQRLKSWFTFKALVDYSIAKRKVLPREIPSSQR